MTQSGWDHGPHHKKQRESDGSLFLFHLFSSNFSARDVAHFEGTHAMSSSRDIAEKVAAVSQSNAAYAVYSIKWVIKYINVGSCHRSQYEVVKNQCSTKAQRPCGDVAVNVKYQ